MTPADTREFFSRILPWPVEDQGRYAGYCSIHWTFPDNKGRRFGKGLPMTRGKPFHTLDAFMSFLDWAKGQQNILDLYFCTSLLNITQEKNGKLQAVRLDKNALAAKHIRLDLDVFVPGVDKVADKKYPSLEDAIVDLQKFIKSANLPPVSALVTSGGGLHVYWIFNRALPIAEWQPYANGLAGAALKYGLRADLGVTTDSVRVLRVPDTFNYKVDPPRPTALLKLGEAFNVGPA